MATVALSRRDGASARIEEQNLNRSRYQRIAKIKSFSCVSLCRVSCLPLRRWILRLRPFSQRVLLSPGIQLLFLSNSTKFPVVERRFAPVPAAVLLEVLVSVRTGALPVVRAEPAAGKTTATAGPAWG